MAANTQITYRVGFQMDTAQAKKSMQDLQSMIKDISSTPVHILDKDSLKDGVHAAQQLEKVLKNAFNINTGNLDLSKFSSGLKQANMSATQLATSLNNFGPSGQRAFQALANSVSSAQLPLKQTSSMVDNLLTNLRKTAQWQISSSIVHGVVGQVKSAIGYVHSLNSSLTDIAIVSDLSSAELAKFAQSAQKMGKALSTSTLDVSNAALIYFQQGDNMVQSLEKAAITIKAANASANSSAQEMSEYLTAVWNSYQVGEQELEKYVDVMAALGAKTATSMEEIATSMQKVAATANTVGVEFDQMSSIIATVSSVTRESAESVGTSFKTILARLGDLKMGNLVEDGEVVKLGLVSSQLQNMGVNILDATGEMRDMGTIIEEIGGKWQGMNSAQKAAVAQTIAGKRQYTQLMALFENWDQYQNNMTIAGDSAGSLDKMQETWEKSWTAASGRVKNAMQGIYDSLINDDFAVGFLDTISTIINGVDTLIDKMGGLGSVIALVGGTMGSKLGNRTHEFVDVLKSNLGLMTGQAQRDLAKTQLEMAAASEKSMMGDQRGTFQATNLRTQAKYTRNQDKLSEAQRQEYAVKMEAAKAAQERELELTDQKNLLDQQSASQKQNITDSFKKSAEDIAFEESKKEIEKLNQEEAAMRARFEELDSKDNLTDDEFAEYDAYDQKMRAIEEKKAQAYGDAQKNVGNKVKESLEGVEVDPIDIDDWLSGDEAKAAEAGDRIGKALVESIEKNTAKIEKIKFNESLREGVIKDDLKKAQKEIDDINKEGSTRSKSDADKIAKETVQKTKARMKLLDKELNADDGAGQAEYQEVLKGLQTDYQDLIQGDEGTLSLKVDGVEETQEGLSRLDSLLEAINKKFTEMETKAQNAVNAAQEVLDEGGAGGEAAKFANTEQEKQEVDTKRADAEKERKQREDEANKAAEPIYTISDAVMGATSALAAAYGVGQAFVGMFNTLRDPDATGWEKFSAVLTGVIGTVTGLSGVMKGLDTVTGFVAAKQKAKNAVAAQGAAIDATNVGTTGAYNAVLAKNTKEEEKNAAAKSKGLKAFLKKVAAIVMGTTSTATDTAVTGVNTTATNVNTTAEIANQLARLGVIGAIIAAVAALTALTVMLIKNAKQEETLAEKIEKTTKAIDRNSDQIKKVKTNLASLGEALKQTGVSYTEQLETINKISQAFGVQASAIEVLTGDYASLNKEVSKIAGYEVGTKASASAQEYLTGYEQFSGQVRSDDREVDEYAEQVGSHIVKTFNGAVNAAQNEYAGFTAERLRENYLTEQLGSPEVVQFLTHLAGGDLSNITGSDEALMEVLTPFVVSQTWDFFESQNVDPIESNRDVGDAVSFAIQDMSDEWRNYWMNDATVAEIFEESGISLTLDSSGTSLVLSEQYDEDGNYVGNIELLVKSLISKGIITSGEIDEENTVGLYFQDLFTELGYDIEALSTLFAREATIGDELAYANLLNSGNYDMLSISTESASLQNVYDLIDEATTDAGTAQWTDNDRVRTNLAKTLSANSTYSESALQYIALSDFATQAINLHPDIELNKQEVMQQLIDIVNADEGLTIEALIKIDPTVVQFDENGKAYIADEAAKQFAIAQAEVEAEQSKQAKYTQAKGVAGKATLTKADYQTLWDTGLFESYEDLDMFVSQSAATRTQEWEFRIAESLEAETEAIEAALPMAEKAYESAVEARDDWEERFFLTDSAKETLGARAAQYDGKTGEALVDALEADRLTLEAEIADFNEIIADYENVVSGKMSEEDFLAAHNITLGPKETLEQRMQSLKSQRNDKQEVLDDYDVVLAEGDAYEQAMLRAGTAVSKYSKDWHAADFAQQQADLTKLATGAKQFADAIGLSGTMGLEGLSILELYDEQMLQNYKTMSSQEWDAYAYNKAIEYYDQLLAMYDEDSAEYTALLQEKELLTRTYNAEIAADETAARERRKKEQQKELEASKNVRDTLESLLEGKSFSDLGAEAIQNLQNNLLDLGYTAEEVDAILKNLGKDQNYTDEESVIAAAQLQTEMLLKDLAKYEQQSANYEKDLGESAKLTVDEIDFSDDSLKGLTDGEVITLQAKLTVLGEVSRTMTGFDIDQENGTYSVHYKTPDGTEKTLTLSTKVETEQIAVSDNGDVVVTYSVPDGSKGQPDSCTLTLTGDASNLGGLTLLTGEDGNTVKITYDAPSGDEAKCELVVSGNTETINMAYDPESGKASVSLDAPEGTQTFTWLGEATLVNCTQGEDGTWSYNAEVSGDGTVSLTPDVNFNDQPGWTQSGDDWIYNANGNLTVTVSYVDENGDPIQLAGGATAIEENEDAIMARQAGAREAYSARLEEEAAEEAAATDTTIEYAQFMSSTDHARHGAARARQVDREAEAVIIDINDYIDSVVTELGRAGGKAEDKIADMMEGIEVPENAKGQAAAISGLAYQNAYNKAVIAMEDMMTNILSDNVVSESERQAIEAGMNLILGLRNGMETYGYTLSETASAECQALLDSMQTALDEHSPSKATMRMGMYLMVGLENGLKSYEPDISVLESKVLTPIRQAFMAFEGDIDGLVTYLKAKYSDIFTDPGDLIVDDISQIVTAQTQTSAIDPINNVEYIVNPRVLVAGSYSYNGTEYATYAEAKAAMDADTEKTDTSGIVANGYQYNGIWYATYAEAKAAMEVDTAAKRQTYVQEAGYTVSQNDDGKWVMSLLDGTEAIILESATSDAEAYTLAYEKALSDEVARMSMKSLFESGFEDEDLDLSDSTKDALNTALTNALDQTGLSLNDVFDPSFDDQGKIDQFWDLFYAEADKVQVKTQNAIDATWSKITETWKNAVDALYDIEEQRAEETLTLWENTYSSIAEMRQKMLEDSDSSITELASSAETLGNIVTALLQDGWALADVMTLIAGGTVEGVTAAQALAAAQPGQYDTESYLTTGSAKWLNTSYDSQGNLQVEDTTYDQMVSNAETDIERIISENGGIMSRDKFNSLTAEQRALIAAQDTSGSLEETADGDWRLVDGADGLSLSSDTIHDLAVAMLKAESIESDSDVDSVIGTAVGKIQSSNQKIVTDAVSYGETIVANMNADQALLEKARDARAKGAKLDDRSVLSETEQKRLMEITGMTLEELNALSPEEFNTKAQSMAKACSDAAEEIRKAIGLISEGEATQFTATQSADGTYDISVQNDVSEERAQEAYDQSYADYGDYQGRSWQEARTLDGVTDKAQWVIEEAEAREAWETARVAAAEQARQDVLAQGPQLETLSEDVVEGAEAYTGSETLNEAADVTHSQIDREGLLEMGQLYGVDPDELDALGDHIQAIAKGSKDFADSLATDAEAADKVALAILRYNKGVEDLSSNYEDYMKIAQKTNKTADESRKLFDGMKKTLGNLLDLPLDYFDDADLGFLTDPKTLELADAVARGVEGSLDDLHDAMLQHEGEQLGLNDTIIGGLSDLAEEVNALGAGEAFQPPQIAIGEGATVSDDLYGAVGTFLSQMGYAEGEAQSKVGEINSALGHMGEGGGFNIEFVPARDIVPGQEYQVPIWSTETVAEGVEAPTITGWRTVTGGEGELPAGAFKISNDFGSSGGNVKKGSGGGGGGAKKHDKREAPERYHKVTKRYDRVSEALDKLDKLKNRAYGKSHLDNLHQESSLLAEQLDLLRQKNDEIMGTKDAEGYLAFDKNKLLTEYGEIQKVLGDFGMEMAFDAFGNISNWEEIERKITELYDKKANQKLSDEEWEKVEKALEEYEEARDQYEETIEIMRQNGIDIEDLINQISEKNLEAIIYKVEYQVELNEQDLSLLEYYQDIFEDDLGKSAELMANLVSQAGEAEQNLAIISEGIKQLEQDYNTIDELTKEAKINSADFQEGLADLNDQLLDQLGELRDKQKEIEELYANTLDLAQEEMDTHIGQLEHITTVMDKYAEIFDLLGKGTDKAYKDTLFRMKNAANLESIQSQQSMYAELTTRRAEFEAKGVENLTELEKAQYDALLEKIQETHEGLLDTVSEGLSVLQEQYQNTIDMIFEDFEERMLGAGQTIADVADRYAYYQETQNRQLSAAQELYEMSKLNRQIEQSIEDASTKANKQILKDLQAQIKARNELKDMTQYDIDLMNLQYELALKKMALEEAQNAKSVVRLTRDNDGNYAYQYTADEDKVAQSYQEYEDVLQQINDLAVNRTTELEQMMVDTQQEYYQMAQEIAKDDLLSREEKILKLEELAKRYEETVLYIQQEYGYVNTDLQNNLATTSNWYKTVVTEDTNTAKTQVADMINNAKTFAEQFTNLLTGDENSIISAFDDYAAAIQTIQDMVETTLTAEGAEAYKTMAEEAGKAALGVVTTLHDELGAINDVTKAWDEQVKKLNEAIAAYQALAAAAIAAQHALGASTTGTTDTSGLGAAAAAATEAGAAAMGNPTAPTTPEPESGNETNNQPDGSTGTGTTPPSTPTAPSNTPSTGAIADSIYEQLAEQLNTLLTSLESYAGAAVVLKDSQITYKNITQDIDINAEFPNVENMDDIKMAFEEIAQWASQWANERT